MKKLRRIFSNSGFTLTENIVAAGIAALALLILLTSVITAANISEKAYNKDKEISDARIDIENQIANSTSAVPESSTVFITFKNNDTTQTDAIQVSRLVSEADKSITIDNKDYSGYYYYAIKK